MSSRFYYDVLGRLVASQNSEQYHHDDMEFSYTKYDGLGRIKEVGELVSNILPDEFTKSLSHRRSKKHHH